MDLQPGQIVRVRSRALSQIQRETPDDRNGGGIRAVAERGTLGVWGSRRPM